MNKSRWCVQGHIGRILVPIILLTVFEAWAIAQIKNNGPTGFGQRALDQALAARHLKASVKVQVGGGGQPESYAITFRKGTAT